MEVTVDVAGSDEQSVSVENPTYADLLACLDLSPHEAAVLVDGTPVPEDEPVTTDHVRVIRLAAGG